MRCEGLLSFFINFAKCTSLMYLRTYFGCVILDLCKRENVFNDVWKIVFVVGSPINHVRASRSFHDIRHKSEYGGFRELHVGCEVSGI